jgi:hypothetical protein
LQSRDDWPIFFQYLNQPHRAVARFPRDIIHHIHERKRRLLGKAGDALNQAHSTGSLKMLSSECANAAQRINQRKIISAREALAIARERFPNLASTGILGAKQSGPPIDLNHVEIALRFLMRCRKSKVPSVHSFDLRQAIGNVSIGATIAAAIALGFSVHSWLGVTDYAPHAMVGVNAADVRRVAMITAK